MCNADPVMLISKSLCRPRLDASSEIIMKVVRRPLGLGANKSF
jgi:hypothetical protein